MDGRPWGDEPLMPHILPMQLIALLGQYGYWVLLPIAVVEGPAITMVAGALVAAGQMDGVTACILLILADLVGDACRVLTPLGVLRQNLQLLGLVKRRPGPR